MTIFIIIINCFNLHSYKLCHPCTHPHGNILNCFLSLFPKFQKSSRNMMELVHENFVVLCSTQEMPFTVIYVTMKIYQNRYFNFCGYACIILCSVKCSKNQIENTHLQRFVIYVRLILCNKTNTENSTSLFNHNCNSQIS
nr:hypothetical protein Iba_chr06aCG0550 [Ipomoea batatas]